LVRLEAAVSFGTLGGEASLKPLKNALRDPSRKVALAAVGALRQAKPAGASKALLGLLVDDEAGRDRRIEAAVALSEFPEVVVKAGLLSTLQKYRIAASRSQDAEDLAAACASSLGALQATEAYEELELMVIDGPGQSLQYVGVRALAQLRDPRAVPLLKEAAAQRYDPLLARLAREALRELAATP
jgi:HEAT repeat protein